MALSDEAPGAGTPDASDNQNPQLAEQEGPMHDISCLHDAPDLGNIDDQCQLSAEAEFSRAERYRAAVSYWERGWRVIPLCWPADAGGCGYDQSISNSGHQDCASPGKIPCDSGWQKPDPLAGETDAQWWRLTTDQDGTFPGNWRPKANLGIVTGQASGIFVVDIDPDNGGDVTWERICAEHPELPLTYITETGSGGRHWYFRYPDDFAVRNSKPWGKDAGIDIRGDGGQVVAPPSTSHKGSYTVIQNAPVAQAPDWLLTRLREQGRLVRGLQSLNAAPVVPGTQLRAYALAALQGEAFALRKAPEGARNDTLNVAALRLGSLGAHDLISEAEAWEALYTAAMECGLGQGETEKTFASGWHAGLRSPRDLSKVREITDHDWPARPWDEGGNGDRIVDHIGDSLRWCEEKASYLEWQAGVWSTVSRVRARSRAWHVIERLPYTEALSYPDERDPESDQQSPRQEFLDWQKKQRNNAAAQNAVDASLRHPVMSLRQSALDADPMHLNLRNGLLDCSSMQFYAHDPGQYLSMQAQVSYDPAAECPLWLRYLKRSQPDPEMRDYLQRIMGYSLTGLTDERAFFVHYGPTAAGKSVFAEVQYQLLGSYAQALAARKLTSLKDDSIPEDIARMAGKRFVKAAEAKRGSRLDTAKLKEIVGGESITARYLYGASFDFKPIAKISLSTNYVSDMDGDDAAWDRTHLVPWLHTIPPEEREKDLVNLIVHQEIAGVLNWALRGLASYLGFKSLLAPGSAEAAKQALRESQDKVWEFVADCCDVTMDAPDNRVLVTNTTTALHEAYKEWFKSAYPGPRDKPLGRKDFSGDLVRRYRRVEARLVYFPQLSIRIQA